MAETRLFELADGRELAWIEYGSPDGVPVVALHGSPGTRWFFAPHAETAARKGVRLIAPDRPGYGHSTYHRGRTYETWARDVGRLADHLGVDRFAVLARSPLATPRSSSALSSALPCGMNSCVRWPRRLVALPCRTSRSS